MNPLGGTATDLTFTDQIQTLPLTEVFPYYLPTYRILSLLSLYHLSGIASWLLTASYRVRIIPANLTLLLLPSP
uniref:Uncharacterized protein n=2 Tax=Picea TaxID=3328 RepID=A0A117NGS4_PICGL|nr:hypothetical protein ABT39_MTgene5440 [Picea glauca]QHR91500.1 hypothetical protein Q903MT_gene5535 [Picea sitchensis]